MAIDIQTPNAIFFAKNSKKTLTNFFEIKRNRATLRHEDKGNLANSYEKREKALGKAYDYIEAKPLVGLVKTNKTSIRKAPAVSLGQVANPAIFSKKEWFVNKLAGDKNTRRIGRQFRVGRSFLRRVRNFRNERRRNFVSTKNLKSERTKVLTKGGENKESKSNRLSSKNQLTKGNEFGLTVLGLQSTRTTYQNQTQPLGLPATVRILSLLTGTSVSVHRINGLALARLGLDRDKVNLENSGNLIGPVTKSNKPQGVNSGRVLAHLRETTGTRLGTSPAAVPDLVRLPFTALYLKAAPALAERLAHGLRTLPRQRKETAFLRSLRKLVKVLAALRPERLGLRIRLQGRVNRWRRTKHIVGERGHLPLYTYNARRESGRCQAITRKGSVGLRVWLAYRPDFAHSFRRTLLSYLRHQR